ncbi:hypothetical protein PHLCEN_2v927 [Hermanssonia centrifuga]|uniref:Transmembrane protein n=1 Tax=Hermanssonia centrifuga TaxID=98765 RepID=A0A2R6S4M7_9APHY|nr:hypothetical protein PHLCEN_2v927 [Hermanssonia centrifuga]
MPGGLHANGQWEEPPTARPESICNQTLAENAGEAPKPDTAYAWGKLLEEMESYDKKIVDTWRDELNNLLIFVAVILFLAGLLVLLYSVNIGIALAFTMVSGIPVLFFLIMTLIPLFLTRCPYKSPLIPTVLVVLKWCIFPVVLVVYVFAIFLLEPVRLAFHRTRISDTVNAVSEAFTTLFSHLAGMRGSLVVDIDRFWTDRELDRLTSRGHSLDPRAMSWALRALPRHRIALIKDCMRDFSQMESIFCVLLAAARSLGTSNIDFWNDSDFVHFSPFCPVNPRMLTRVNHQFKEQHRDSLLEVLPRDWSTGNWMISGKPAPDYRKRVPSILMLLWAIARHDLHSDFPVVFTKLLIPTLDHRLSVEQHREATRALRWAKEELDVVKELSIHTFTGEAQLDDYRLKINALEIVLGSSAIALLAVSQWPSIVQVNSPLRPLFCDFLDTLEEFIAQRKDDIRYVGHLCRAQPWDTTIVVTPRAVVTICKNLKRLEEKVILPVREHDCPSQRLTEHFGIICKDHRNVHLREAKLYVERPRRQDSSETS